MVVLRRPECDRLERLALMAQQPCGSQCPPVVPTFFRNVLRFMAVLPDQCVLVFPALCDDPARSKTSTCYVNRDFHVGPRPKEMLTPICLLWSRWEQFFFLARPSRSRHGQFCPLGGRRNQRPPLCRHNMLRRPFSLDSEFLQSVDEAQIYETIF